MPKDATKPLQRLGALGQSVWVDFLSRDSIQGGRLQELIDDFSIVGATSNPTIFQKAMSAGNAYDEQIHELAESGADVTATFWALAQKDIQDACDVFAPVHEVSARHDGYVSLEVDPRLAYDTLETFREAMRLHEQVGRRNLMVKIPATRPGLAAVEDVIAKGRSVNVTLIFSLRRYADVAESYIRGLERLIAEGGDPGSVASVASFFVSRIDTEADRRLQELGAPARLYGQLAVANARLAYGHYLEAFAGRRWEYLAGKGARPQRVLWASTSTKNPAYPDTLYVDELIGPQTVNTMPEETIKAFQDHGRTEPRLQAGFEQAARLLGELERIGIDYEDLTDTLEREGVEKFADSFAEVIDSLAEKRGSLAPA